MTEQLIGIPDQKPDVPPLVIDTNVTRVDGANDRDLIFKKFQDIPDSFVQGLRDQEARAPKGAEMRKIASIPVAVVEHWLKQGFDVHKESAQAIVNRLSTEDLGAFIVGKP